MRKLLVLAIASCSSSAPPEPASQIVPRAVCAAAPTIDPWNPPTTSVVTLFWFDALAALAPPAVRGKVFAVAATPHPATTSAHGSTVTVVAAIEDGSIAVTADATGAMRLWPALDGTKEPVVVAANPAIALAVARDGGDVVIAGLDAAGKLELVRTTATGAPLGRVAVESPRPYRLVRAAAGAVLAVRDDQRIDRIDARGGIVASLTPEPGQRVGALATRRGRVIAIVASSEGVRGRWLALASGLAWGDATPKLPIDPDAAELSPDLHHLVAIYAPLHTAATVNLDTGRTYAIPWEREDFKEPMNPVGFTAPDKLALASTFGGGVMWWQEQTTTRGIPGFDERGGGVHFAVDGRVITGFGNILVITTRETSKYLGYQRINLHHVRGTRDGWLVTDYPGAEILQLDTHFRERHRYEAPNEVSALFLVDDHHAVAMLAVDRGRARNLYSLDLLHPEATELAWQSTGYLNGYEPSTRLIAVSDENEIAFAHVDPKTGVIGVPVRYRIDGRPYSHQAYLLDPARSKRNVALVVDTDYASHTISVIEIRAICETCSSDEQVKVARTYDVDATAPNAHDKILRDHGLTPDGKPTSRRSPDGKWVAAADGRRITLRDKAGKTRWVADAHGAYDVAWRGTGELVAIGNGLAAVDVETGALGERQCGWRFGLFDQPVTDRSIGPMICDAP